MGGDFGSHNDNAVGIYCAEAKETNESIVSATHKILPSKNAKRTPTEEKKKKLQDIAYEKQWKMKLEKWAPMSPSTSNAMQISALIDRQWRVWKFWIEEWYDQPFKVLRIKNINDSTG